MLRIFLGILLTGLVVSVSYAQSMCSACHRSEVRQWEKSQHAMAIPTPETVAGNFDDASYQSGDLVVRFRRQGDHYLIKVRQGDMPEASYSVAYTFGIYPLQQYLFETENGRLQAFNIARDARPQKEGGQRWFGLGIESAGHPGDTFHWTGIYQNWNSQCADCHSTGLTGNYDPDSDSYNTTRKHLSVGCDACDHNAEAHAQGQMSGKSLGAGVGLAAMGSWLSGKNGRPPRHRGESSSPEQVPTCGECHSLRTRLSEASSRRVHDDFRLSLLNEALYFPDGQIREEVFVLGSFEQS